MHAIQPPHSDLLRFLPEERVGSVESIEPVTLGLSGAGVYAVKAAHGEFILRLQGAANDEHYFAQQLRVLRRAAAAGVAPAVVHVDEEARAVVSVRVNGQPMAVVLGDPTQREPLFASLIDRLRVVHALDTEGVAERDPLAQARRIWESGRSRAGFPDWAAALAPIFDATEAALARDRRRVISHNDVNPRNVLWDGARAWLVDWEVSALGHPYFDLATLALFLRLEDDVAFALVARHDGAPADAGAREIFRALRRLAGLLCGLTFLGMVDDLTAHPAPSLAEAPTLANVYGAMRAGQLRMETPHGHASMGVALLADALR